MSPLKRSNNIAARMGRWSASHWKTAVFGWLVFVVAALFIGNFVGTKNIETADANVGQAHKADQILKKAFPQVDPQTELVLVQSSSKTVRDPAFRATIKDVESTIAGNPAIKNVRSPLDPANADQVSKDGRSAMVLWDMKGTYENAKPKIDGIVVRGRQGRRPASWVLRRGSRLGQFREGTRQDVLRPAQAGRRALDPDHDRRPAARLRRTRRRRRAAAARTLGRDGDDRPRRTAEPHRPDGSERVGSDPARRARGRRRLLALLSQA